MNSETRNRLTERLREVFPKKQLLADAPMEKYTTVRAGGRADLLAEVSDASQVSFALKAAAELGVPVFIAGNGSNLLVRDGGLHALVLHMGELFSGISDPVPLPDGRLSITVQAGAPLIKLSNAAAAAGLGGLEFAAGIPGSVGGGVYMNAGAYGGEMKNVVSLVTAVKPNGEPCTFTGEELQMSYRHTVLTNSGIVVTGVTVCLMPGDSETILATMREFNARRRQKQPITLPSCGSTFKRPEGNFAGTLIEQCGLKGLRIGGCSVSTLHAGFLVNDQNGSATDYLNLVRTVQNVVKEKTGISLEPEVCIVGDAGPAETGESEKNAD